MIQSLLIRNYVLIDEVNITFQKGFTSVTGETGAGKSVFVGAMSLLTGERADTSVLHDKDSKCIVEGRFFIKGYELESLFSENELDYDNTTIIRREISANGKSRAFVNDTPVQLSFLKTLGGFLIDVHSQHENLLMGNSGFQINILDAFGNIVSEVSAYRKLFHVWKMKNKELEVIKSEAAKQKSDLDYFEFQFNQLNEAKLIDSEQASLEEELELLKHAEDIKSALSAVSQLLDQNDQGNAIQIIRQAVSEFSSIEKFSSKAGELQERLNSLYIECRDIADETDSLNESISYDPERLQQVGERLDIIYSLQQKHGVQTITELITLMNELDEKISSITSFDDRIEAMEKEISNIEKDLFKMAGEISAKRKKCVKGLSDEVLSCLKDLGMPNASFSVDIQPESGISENGLDRVAFLFSANKNIAPKEISKVASGGELARLMLSVKSLGTDKTVAPTIVFDEIDTGVSGETADKMGQIMRRIANKRQVIGITHLPQIASKGIQHLVVSKDESSSRAYTRISEIRGDDRIVHIAKMLSGEQTTDAALENAKQLLNN